eukprot:jgi/Mesen1/3821/ME000207S02834
MSEESPFKKNVLSGKVCLITGGGSGIGFEIARQFGRHGARVSIMGRRGNILEEAVRNLEAEGIEAMYVQGDVRKREDADRVVKSTFDRFGRLDILVNGAAGNFLAASEDLSSNAFRTVLDIDAVGTFTMSVAARPYLAKGGPGKAPSEEGGCIVSISATLHYTAAWYQVHVSAAKWGHDYGIRANVVAPGPIGNTPGMSKLAPAEAQLDPGAFVPLGRMGDTWDIAMASLYLCSSAGKYVSGATLVVDGAGWLHRPRHLSKASVRHLSRLVEKRSRGGGGGAGDGGSKEASGGTVGKLQSRL